MRAKPLNPWTLAISREELARLSGFRLPKTAAREGRREVVPALTAAQIRNLDRYGLFDAYQIHLEHRFTGGPLVTWRPRTPRTRGEARFYRGLVDVATARLAAWMLAEGLTYTQVVLALRTEMVRACFSPRTLAEDSDDVVFVRGADIGLSNARDLGRQGLLAALHAHQRFPLAWLGMGSDALPRLQKLAEAQPDVWRQHWMPRAEAEALTV